MKTVKLLITTMVVLILGLTSTAQTNAQTKMNMPATKTETIKVSGNCDMCKTRIEKAAMKEGASSADWSTKTKVLTLTFDPSKTNADAFAKKIALVGHDTEKFKAPDEVYAKLPGCCKYERLK